jgi:hypothetical protein
MDPLQFCYWLQGFNELNTSGKPPGELQWKIIQDHLSTVFNKVTPTYPGGVYPEVFPMPSSPPWTITCETNANTQTMAIC